MERFLKKAAKGAFFVLSLALYSCGNSSDKGLRADSPRAEIRTDSRSTSENTPRDIAPKVTRDSDTSAPVADTPAPKKVFPRPVVIPFPAHANPDNLRDVKVAPQTEWSSCAKGSMPDLLPYKKGRIDVFLMRDEGTPLSTFSSEFMVLSLDGVVKSAGLVSSGKPHLNKTTQKVEGEVTPAGRYYIFALDRDHRQKTEVEGTDELKDGSYMPYDIMLSAERPIYSGERKRKNLNKAPVVGNYSQRNFHGTYNYGYGTFGRPASHGCIRNFTIKDIFVPYRTYDGRELNDEPKRLQQWGLHRLNWDYLNPFGWDHVDIIPNRATNRFVSGKGWPGEWFADKNRRADGNLDLANGTSMGLEEMSKKIRIEFHDLDTIRVRPGKQQILEDLYKHVTYTLKRTPYMDFANGDMLADVGVESYKNLRLDPELLSDLENMESGRPPKVLKALPVGQN